MRYERKYLKILKNVSRNLKKQREVSGLTQEKLAEMVGFSTRYYQKLESGTQSPNLLTLYKVCAQLRVDIAVLFK